MALELLEPEILETGSGFDIVHDFCVDCYPVEHTEVSYCGMDISGEPFLDESRDNTWCSMCMLVLDSWPVKRGAKVCPKGHRQ